mmetsp:Transcript_5448/g.8953  ORF Transcript_5448/g.8953 Transcript_5448/m.8953 type:complete len:214 (+) Transcript_5448:1421-2062(+)
MNNESSNVSGYACNDSTIPVTITCLNSYAAFCIKNFPRKLMRSWRLDGYETLSCKMLLTMLARNSFSIVPSRTDTFSSNSMTMLSVAVFNDVVIASVATSEFSSSKSFNTSWLQLATILGYFSAIPATALRAPKRTQGLGDIRRDSRIPTTGYRSSVAEGSITKALAASYTTSSDECSKQLVRNTCPSRHTVDPFWRLIPGYASLSSSMSFVV